MNRKEKTKVCDKRGDLDDKRLAQNKVLCSFSEVKLLPCRLSDTLCAKKTDFWLSANFWF